jgi:hypothetical protein
LIHANNCWFSMKQLFCCMNDYVWNGVVFFLICGGDDCWIVCLDFQLVLCDRLN